MIERIFTYLKPNIMIQQFLCNFAVTLVQPGQGGQPAGSVVNEELLVYQVDQVLCSRWLQVKASPVSILKTICAYF